ncbi:NAD(P)-dependent alcohol dehydrogenase [Gracilibacillus kekensis]|uniref:NADPH:quinone reductase n=1 Tax=Gracilibacillus kekensis TaxID=1027249 RepID=A0A1M7LJX8_9BACI|nr:NAD(P)-dependent alcohol dehydrogenase [Gracilibacillus kekensis]SHM78385.1 NADPH:quinone reductase [Gracilibacillus kekensis]
MKAIVYKKYGTADVLNLREVDKPITGDHLVLVRIHAASLNYGNLLMIKGKPLVARLSYGLLKPKHVIPGGDIAGEVEAVGKDVTQFRAGDKVFGDLANFGWGGFAEYVSVSEHALSIKPGNLSYEEAAAIPTAAVTALQALRDKGNIQAGQKVLIYGASGGVGSFAVQIAKSFGAEVTGVCSTRNTDMLRKLGADHVMDYTKESFHSNKQKYDLILAVNGYQPLFRYLHALSRKGTFVHVGGSGVQMIQAMMLGPIISRIATKKVKSHVQQQSQSDLIFLKDLAEAGEIDLFIDKHFTLAEVPEAFHHYEQGHAQGKIVIKI